MPYAGNPSWPPNYQTGTIFGKFIGSDGVPVVGIISFTPRPAAVIVPSDAWTVVARSSLAVLDATGAFSIELPATDDPDVRPVKFTYAVVEQWENGRSYDITVPAGVSTNIFDQAPAQPSIGIMRYIGPAGPAGPPGAGVGPLTWVQTTPASSVAIPHTFGRLPSVQIYRAGELVETDVTADTGHVYVSFPTPTAFTGILV